MAAYCAYKIFSKVFELSKITDDLEYIKSINKFVDDAADQVITGPISELDKKKEKVGLA